MAVALLVAAGSGERLGAGRPKAFVVLAGRPMLEWSLEALRTAGIEDIVVAAPPGHEVAGCVTVPGGATRSESVRAALAAAPPGDVVVHDAARPLVTEDLVRECLAALLGVDGVVAAVPVSDTIKEVYPDGTVARTLERSRLWAVQTPQVFRAEMLRRSLDVEESVLAAATDDASLVEAAGGSVRVVEAPPENIKVTTAADLARAEAALC